jgi:uncharacterized Zn finger protein
VIEKEKQGEKTSKTPRRRHTDLPGDAAREEKHPGDAIPIYQEMIAPILKQANNAAYEEAVKLLQKIRELISRLDRVTEFEDYVEALRVEYKRKRNFIKLLDTIESL